MTTNYDDISSDYQASKFQPWRTHIENYTLMQLAGDLRGKKVLDMACGEGFYTRRLRQAGADPITGIDLSQGMVDLAKTQEDAQPLGIEYLVCDARDIDKKGTCDLVFAAWLLNYARDYEELLAMCKAIAHSLKPGGRFLTVNNNPDDPLENFSSGKQYGFTKQLNGPLVEGAEIIYHLTLADRSFTITNYYLKLDTMKRALTAAGLVEICCYPPQVSQEGIQEWGEEHWKPFLTHPPLIFLDCYKQPS